MQADDALGQPGAAGVPQAHDRHRVGERPLVGGEDDLAASLAHRPSHPAGVGDEDHGGGAVDLDPGRHHAGVVRLGEQLDGVEVGERQQPQHGVAGVDLYGEVARARGGRHE